MERVGVVHPQEADRRSCLRVERTEGAQVDLDRSPAQISVEGRAGRDQIS
jgi:hypothetical protein